jgi:hypothetical protein
MATEIHAICSIDHSPEGAKAGALVATFPDRQAALNRGIGESYPRCSIELVEVTVAGGGE